MTKNSAIKLVLKQYWQSKLNRIGLVFVVAMFFIAVFAPFLAGNGPLYLKMENKTYFPVLTQVAPFKFFYKKSALRDVDFIKVRAIHELPLQRDELPLQKIIFPPIPYSPTEYNLDIPLEAPNKEHPLGTDDQGRDVASRMIHGSRISLSVGFVAVGIYVIIGTIIGALCGFYGGKFDMIISRIIEIIMCFPTFFLILAVIAFIGPSLFNIMVIIGLTSWTGIARLVRGEFLRLRPLDFATTAQALGFSSGRIIFNHLLPNALAPAMVAATFGMASAVLVESSLSFLGFGVQPPTPSWGDILSQSHDYIDIAWWLTLYPGLAIFLTITSLNLVGEGLRNAIDPKMKT